MTNYDFSPIGLTVLTWLLGGLISYPSWTSFGWYRTINKSPIYVPGLVLPFVDIVKYGLFAAAWVQENHDTVDGNWILFLSMWFSAYLVLCISWDSFFYARRRYLGAMVVSSLMLGDCLALALICENDIARIMLGVVGLWHLFMTASVFMVWKENPDERDTVAGN